MPLSYHAKGTYHLRVPIERNTTEKVGEFRSDVGEHTKYWGPVLKQTDWSELWKTSGACL
jgi:hypothetical protein